VRADEPPPEVTPARRRATDATEISRQPTIEQRTGLSGAPDRPRSHNPRDGDDFQAWSSLMTDDHEVVPGPEATAEPASEPPHTEAALDADENQPDARPEVDLDLTSEEHSLLSDDDGVAVLATDGEFERDADAFFGAEVDRPGFRRGPSRSEAARRRRPVRDEMNEPQAPDVDPRPDGAGRNIGVAAVVGFSLAAIGGFALFLGGAFTVVLITAILAVCAVEFFNAVLRAGFAPATLLGLMAVVAMPLGVYWRGAEAYPVVLYLSVMAGLAWYLLGVTKDRPVRNLGVTLLGIFYIGGLGSFGARIALEDFGISTLLSAILLTIAYDLGGYTIGRTAGRTPLTAASPNKTWEGLIGGSAVSLITAVIAVGVLDLGVFGGGNLVHAVVLGLIVPVAAALGDLSESLIKRDLGIKDMSDFLPGHGGFLDRFDAMLFVLPATYYLAVVLDLFPT